MSTSRNGYIFGVREDNDNSISADVKELSREINVIQKQINSLKLSSAKHDLDLDYLIGVTGELVKKLPPNEKTGDSDEQPKKKEVKEVVEMAPGPFSWIKDLLTEVDGNRERIEHLRELTAQRIRELTKSEHRGAYQVIFQASLLALYNALLGKFKDALSVTDEVSDVIEDEIKSGKEKDDSQVNVLRTCTALMYAVQANILFLWDADLYAEEIRKLVNIANKLDTNDVDTEAAMLVCKGLFIESMRKGDASAVKEMLKMLKQATILIPISMSNLASHDWGKEYMEALERNRNCRDSIQQRK